MDNILTSDNITIILDDKTLHDVYSMQLNASAENELIKLILNRMILEEDDTPHLDEFNRARTYPYQTIISDIYKVKSKLIIECESFEMD